MKQPKVKQVRTAPPAVAPPAESAFPPWRIALAVFFAAALLRMAWLGEAAFRADTLHFFQWAQQGLSFSQVFSQWMRIMGETAQFPLPAAIAVGLADWLPLPASGFSIRLADALLGGVAVLFGAMAARELGGRGLFWLAAALWTFNPYHLQMSREAYFYATLVTGSAMLTWCVLHAAGRMDRPEPLARSLHVTFGLGLLLAAYSHFTGWIIASLAGLAMLVIGWRRRRAGAPVGEWNLLAVIAVVLAFPLLFFPWAVPYFIKDIGNPAAKAESIRVMGEVTEPLTSILGRYFTTMAWGNPWYGLVFLALGLAGVIMLAWRSEHRRTVRIALVLFAASLLSYILIMKARGIYVAVRHISFLFPLFMTLVAAGLWLPCWLGGPSGEGGSRWRGAWRLVPGVAAVVLLLYPAWHVLHLTGYPTPYREIKEWFDRSLPSGTPVLVDRWFEPWNELTVYPTTNVIFTFTAPNEPLDVFLSSNWREQARQFLVNNPDAAYFEVAKSYWEKPGVGPWDWPRTFFARHTSISNASGLVLRDLGVAYREDFYTPNTNRVVVEIFYNTREDILEKMRQSGRAVHMLFGEGFTFEKSGPMGIFRVQTQSFADWRLMQRQGTLEVVNVSDQPVTVGLRVLAVAPGQGKTVAAGSQRQQFPPNQMQSWDIGPMEIQPGITPVQLVDPYWDRTMSPLLVSRVEILPWPAGATANE